MPVKTPISPPPIKITHQSDCVSTGRSVGHMQASTEFKRQELFVEFAGGHSALHGGPYSHSSFLFENLTFGILLPLPLHQQPRIVICLKESGQLMPRETPRTKRINQIAQDFEFNANVERRPVGTFTLESNVAILQLDKLRLEARSLERGEQVI